MRVIMEGDLSTLAMHRNNFSTWGNLTSGLPVMPHKQKEWLASLDDKNMYFIAKIDTQDVGLLRITDVDWQNSTACVGLDIFEQQRGKGYASLCFDTLVSYCLYELNLHRLWLLVLENNIAAIKIYERAGFKHEGAMRKHIFRHGEYLDYLMMGMLADEYTEI